MQGGRQLFLNAILFFAFLFSCPLFNLSQISGEAFQKILRQQASFTPDDLAALGNGEMVVKVLKTDEKNEIGVCGVIRMQKMPDVSMKRFQESLGQKKDRSLLDQGDFSKPAVMADLSSMTLDRRDFDAMKKCSVGDCDLKLPAEMIERLQSDVDWSASEGDARATQLFQQMLVDYVNDYLTRGDSALMQYDNRKNPVRIADEQRELLGKLLFIDEFAPEFTRYLRNFPRSRLSAVDNDVQWSSVTFGLEPFITVTHSAAYSRRDERHSQFLIATRQIYSSRFMDSSLALAMLVSVPVNDSSETYLVFTNFSRSDALKGIFGGFVRRLVGNEATAKTKTVLETAKARLEYRESAPEQPEPTSGTTGTTTGPILAQLRSPLVQVLLVVAAAMVLFGLFRFWRR